MRTRFFFFSVVLLGTTACSEDRYGASSESAIVDGPVAETTRAPRGAEVARCWVETETWTATARCLATDAPNESVRNLVVVGASGLPMALSSEASVSVDSFAASALPRLATLVFDLDLARFAGAPSAVHTLRTQFTLDASHTKETPLSVRLPFASWAVALRARAAFELRLAAYEAPLDEGSPVAIGETAVHLAPGETQKLNLLVPVSSSIAGMLRIGDSETQAVTIDAGGTYAIDGAGLQRIDQPQATALASCWIGGGALRCAASEDKKAPFMVEAASARATAHKWLVEWVTAGIMVSDLSTGRRTGPISAAEPVTLGDLATDGYPYTIGLDAYPAFEEPVLGLRDGLPNAALHLDTIVAAPSDLDADMPLRASLPFSLWKVAIQCPGREAWFGQSEPRSVHVATDWGDWKAGTNLALDADFVECDPSRGIATREYLIPVDGASTVVRLASSAGVIDGPGLYTASPNGLRR